MTTNNDTTQQPDTEFGLRRSVQLLKEDPKAAKEAFKAASKAYCPSCEQFITHKEGLEWCKDQKMLESTLQRRAVARAKSRGWDVKHVGKGTVATDAAGAPIMVSSAKSFPDLFLLHEGQRRVLAIELKRMQGKFEPGQLEYLQLLNLCGVPAVVIRPVDLRNGVLNAILGPQ